jgi:hypothetical protein
VIDLAAGELPGACLLVIFWRLMQMGFWYPPANGVSRSGDYPRQKQLTPLSTREAGAKSLDTVAQTLKALAAEIRKHANNPSCGDDVLSSLETGARIVSETVDAYDNEARKRMRQCIAEAEGNDY